MTLLNMIIKKALSNECVNENRCHSPPPSKESKILLFKRKKDKYSHVKPSVDTSAPVFDPFPWTRYLESWQSREANLLRENLAHVILLRRAFLHKGRVDSRWKVEPPTFDRYYQQLRIDFINRTHRDNLIIYKRLSTAKPKVVTTKSLIKDYNLWLKETKRRCKGNTVLFNTKAVEWPAPSVGVCRPRAWLHLRVEDKCSIGSIQVELFTDVVPATCHLFTSLLAGDGVGYGYVGTSFFRKVPGLYWWGGDVVFDNGFGCYAEVGRSQPIPAENFHFPHSAPGLLSMRVTVDNETCCTFNITFKALPQFDLKNVVFGRVILPCSTFEVMRNLGDPLSSQPRVVIEGTKLQKEGKWVEGVKNTRLVAIPPRKIRRQP